MKTSLVPVAAVATLAAALSLVCVERATHEPAAVATQAEGAKLLSRLPVAFVPNLGQWQDRAAYVARFGAMTVFFEEDGWTFTLVERTGEVEKALEFDARAAREPEPEPVPTRGVAVRMTFEGAGAAELAPQQRLPGVHHYFLGNDPEKWRSDVPLYGAVRYREIHPGIDVLAREQDGHFEYDLVLEPGAERSE